MVDAQSKAERSEPVASVAEVRADGQRLYNTVYPSDALDKFPIGTLLYTSPPTSEIEALRKRVAELEEEAAIYLEELIEHTGDGMDDMRQRRIGELRTARRVREGGSDA